MTRREFLKGSAGLILACGAGFGVHKLKKALAPSAEKAVGPMLLPELSLIPDPDGTQGWLDGLPVFRANETGGKLLHYADGRHSFAQILSLSGCEDEASAAALFVTLGKAGYLANRFEVNQIERRA